MAPSDAVIVPDAPVVAAAGERLVAPSTRGHLLARLLLLVLLIAGVVDAALQPADRTPDELVAALDAGEVATLTVERPTVPTVGEVGAEWTGAGRDGRTTYRFDSVSDTREDDGLRLLAAAAASPRHVEVREVDSLPPRSSPTWQLVLALGTLVGVVALVLGGPEPRFATRWAWFWLCLHAWPVALAHLLLEPTPAWDRRPVVGPPRRLTGGWAFLLGALLGPPLLRALSGG